MNNSIFVMESLIHDLSLKLLYWDGVTEKDKTKSRRKQPFPDYNYSSQK